jgi:hypothetical protein
LPRMLAKARGEAVTTVPREAPAVAAHDCRAEFDPHRCAECRRRDPEPTNGVDRWSRHWAGPFNPRCPDCRKLGSACDAADKAAS